jgi:hypothetical protein
LGVEGAHFQDPAIADKAECDTKRIRDVEQGEEPRSAKDDQRSVEMMLEATEPRLWESNTVKCCVIVTHTQDHIKLFYFIISLFYLHTNLCNYLQVELWRRR